VYTKLNIHNETKTWCRLGAFSSFGQEMDRAYPTASSICIRMNMKIIFGKLQKITFQIFR